MAFKKVITAAQKEWMVCFGFFPPIIIPRVPVRHGAWMAHGWAVSGRGRGLGPSLLLSGRLPGEEGARALHSPPTPGGEEAWLSGSRETLEARKCGVWGGGQSDSSICGPGLGRGHVRRGDRALVLAKQGFVLLGWCCCYW